MHDWCVQELLLSYNIGVDRDVRQRRMVQSTAARVGLRLPTTDDGQVRFSHLKFSLKHQTSPHGAICQTGGLLRKQTVCLSQLPLHRVLTMHP